jgi:hypothetical protein
VRRPHVRAARESRRASKGPVTPELSGSSRIAAKAMTDGKNGTDAFPPAAFLRWKRGAVWQTSGWTPAYRSCPPFGSDRCAENWSGYSSFSGRSPSEPRSVIWAASDAFETPAMMASASNRTAESRASSPGGRPSGSYPHKAG